MNKNIKRKIQEFVEQEQKSPIDQDLLTKLHSLLEHDTMYWVLDPDRRNALNTFFKDLHDEFMAAMFVDKYGAHIIMDSLIVTAFEVGYELGFEGGLSPIQK